MQRQPPTRLHAAQRCVWSLVWTMVAVLLWAAGCSPGPRRVDPPVLSYDTPTLTRLSAEAHARDVRGAVSLPVADTHSMEPLIRGGDLLVIAIAPWEPKNLAGRVLMYWPEWTTEYPLVVHRAVAVDRDGLLMSGDNVRPQIDPRTGRNLVSENRYRVTAANYVGAVVGIYRTKP